MTVYKTPFDRLLGKKAGLTGRELGEGGWGPEEGGGGLRKRAEGLGVVGAQRGLGP